MSIEQKIHDILAGGILDAKKELLLFVNQTKEVINYQTNKQSYIKELLTNYSNLSTYKDGYISFFGRWFVNSGFPILSEDELLFQMERFYLCYVEKPMLGVDVAICAAENEGRFFLERWSKYNWLRNLLNLMSEPQQIQAKMILPVGLQTCDAIRRFDKAESAGIIIRTATGYRKNGITKAQLAYFLKRIYLQDGISGGLFPDKELSTIFGESRIGAALTALMNNKEGGGKPKGYNVIDNLFLD